MSEDRLIDTFGRVADDLRISVTDRCNFRCVYCMPAEGLNWLEKSKLLTFEEITRLAAIFRDLGVRTFRLTGGEPTLRRDLDRLVGMLHETAPDADLAMTTNGFLLESLAEPLANAGLHRVNVSLDSLLKHRFAEITRRDALDSVMAGLAAATRAGLGPIKLNCVLVRGTNDDELLDFARLARSTGYEVRFIEFMPLDAERKWTRRMVVSLDEIIEKIGSHFPLIAAEQEGGSGGVAAPRGTRSERQRLRPPRKEKQPATVFRFADGAPGSVGVIPSVTAPFCDSCNRLRITADGQLRTCLFSIQETNLKQMLRSGSSDSDIAAAIRTAVAGKEAGHRINEEDFVRPDRSMSMIGG